MNTGFGAFVAFMFEILLESRCSGGVRLTNSVVMCFLEICLMVKLGVLQLVSRFIGNCDYS